jgi:hypothetical protein
MADGFLVASIIALCIEALVFYPLVRLAWWGQVEDFWLLWELSFVSCASLVVASYMLRYTPVALLLSVVAIGLLSVVILRGHFHVIVRSRLWWFQVVYVAALFTWSVLTAKPEIAFWGVLIVAIPQSFFFWYHMRLHEDRLTIAFHSVAGALTLVATAKFTPASVIVPILFLCLGLLPLLEWLGARYAHTSAMIHSRQFLEQGTRSVSQWISHFSHRSSHRFWQWRRSSGLRRGQ